MDLVETAAQRAGRHRAGLVVGVIGPDGRRTYASSGRLEHPDQRALFEIGSVTKVFTATVLAEEVVRGRLRLDQPVRELLPPGSTVPTRDGAEITLAHLATHTSGLPGAPVRGVKPWVEFLRGRNPYTAVTPEVLLEHLAGTTLKRRPGSGGVRYSNLGYSLLGVALVHASGSPDFHTLVTDRVCRPLGMLRTGVDVPDGDVVPGHRMGGRPADRWHLTGVAGAGALVSDADDLLTFLTAQLDPDSTPLAAAIRLTQEERLGGRRGIGLGWMRNPRPRLLVWHNGGTGGFRSFAGFVPERRTGVVVLSNQSRSVDLVALRLLRELDLRSSGGADDR